MLMSRRKSQVIKGNRILITVNFLGSAGPIRLVVNEEQLVADIIATALKSYAREGRLPILGSIINDFLLYCPAAGSDAMLPWEAIGAHGTRNFTLCKKPKPTKEMVVAVSVQDNSSSTSVEKKGNGSSLKAWINKSFAFKVASH